MKNNPRLIEIKAIIRRHMLDKVIDALHGSPELPGVTISEVTGVGHVGPASGDAVTYGYVKMAKLEIVVAETFSETVRDLISTHARTGLPGDGIIFCNAVDSATRVRTGQSAFPSADEGDEQEPE